MKNQYNMNSSLSCKTDSFGDIHPDISNFSGVSLTEELNKLIRHPDYSKKSFKIRMPYTEGGKAEAIKRAGFIIHGANSDFVDWIRRNGVNTPYAMTGYAQVTIAIIYQRKILMVEKKSEPGLATLVSGQVMDGEFPVEAGVRIIEETLRVALDAKKLVLFGTCTRVYVNVYGAMQFGYIYAYVPSNESDIVTLFNRNEILQVFWAPLPYLVTARSIASPNNVDLKSNPLITALSSHVLDTEYTVDEAGMPATRFCKHIELPDCRQWNKTTNADTGDIMHLDLF